MESCVRGKGNGCDKNDEGTNVGANIRRIRLESDIGQTDLVRILQLMGADITREALVKIEKGRSI